ncbi:von willebrand factor type a domain containing protein [Entamoeba marina]
MENELVLTLPSPTSQKNLPFSIKISGKSPFTFKGVLTEEMEVTVPNDVEGIYVMNDEDLGETNGMVTFINKEEEGEINVVFVCDRSGSMYGSGINALKETLQLFLRQLPENSKFNIISFGDNFDGLYKESKVYNDESLDFASQCVKKWSSLWRRKTQILELLKTSCITSICHAIGLGDSVDEQLIRDIARVGGGISSISKNPADLRNAVSRITQRILRPSISNASISSSNSITFEPKTIGKFTSDTTVYFTLNEDQVKDVNEMKTTLKGDVNGKEIVYTASIKEITNGMLIGQLDGARQLKLAEAINDKEKAIKLSLKYNILSRFTAFIAIDTSKKLPIDDIKTIKLTGRSFYEEAESGSYNFSPTSCISLDINECIDCEFIGEEECEREFGSDADFSSFTYEPQIEREKCEELCEELCEQKETIELLKLDKNCENKPCCFEKEIEEEPQELVEKQKEIKEENEKQSQSQSQQPQSFDSIIELQRADGHFSNIQKVYANLTDLEKKFSNLEIEVLSTIIAICILRTTFKEKKVQWDLLVKKALNYLKKKGINDDVINQVATEIKI